MNTRILTVDEDNPKIEEIQIAAEVLKNGGTVVFPTETVYGLGANALDENAIRKIYEAKGRPSDNPLIVHVTKFKDILPLIIEVPKYLDKLIERLCPGPLTFILKKSQNVPKITTGGLETVAVRIPNHNVAQSLINQSGLPIAAPSANISGKPSPTCGNHVIADLNGRVDVIIDGGCSNVGVESTVLDLTQDIPMILRPGAITKEQLEDIIGRVEIDNAILKKSTNIIAKAPGMKYKHYAPDAEVTIVEGSLEDMTKKINELAKQYGIQNKKVGIIATDQTKDIYDCKHVISLGNRENLNEIASNLFTVLREFDNIKVDIILSESFENNGVGLAVMNRLTKAAGYNIIKA